jgi:hypothetical protein
MRWYVQLLPFCIVAWIARRYCELWQIGHITYAEVRFGKRVTLIEAYRDDEGVTYEQFA